MPSQRNVLAAFTACFLVGLGAGGCDQPAAPPAPAPAPPPAPATPAAPAQASAGKDLLKDPAAAIAPAVKAATKDLPLPPDLVQFQAEVARATAQVDLVVSKLDVLGGATGDLEKPHEDYGAALKALETETAGVRKRADDMRERGAAYFETWEKSLAAMTTPEVKDLAEKRKADLQAKYTELLTAMQEARAAYDPFVAGLQGIQKKLDDSLTAASLKEVAPEIARVKEGARTLKDRIATALTKLGAVSAIYAQP